MEMQRALPTPRLLDSQTPSSMTDVLKNLSFLTPTSVIDSMESSDYLTHILTPRFGVFQHLEMSPSRDREGAVLREGSSRTLHGRLNWYQQIAESPLIQHFIITMSLALVCLAGCSSQKAQTAGPPAMPPAPVSVAVATQESVPVQLSAVGTVEPSDTVQVKSQIAGELTAVHFKEGADIQQGDPLFDIDKRPYLEAVRQAEAALARDSALKTQAEANEGRSEERRVGKE